MDACRRSGYGDAIMIDVGRIDLHIAYMIVPLALVLLFLEGATIGYAAALGVVSLIAFLYLMVRVHQEIKAHHEWKEYLVVNVLFVTLADAAAIGLRYLLAAGNR
jgi:hypothetical protein